MKPAPEFYSLRDSVNPDHRVECHPVRAVGEVATPEVGFVRREATRSEPRDNVGVLRLGANGQTRYLKDERPRRLSVATGREGHPNVSWQGRENRAEDEE